MCGEVLGLLYAFDDVLVEPLMPDGAIVALDIGPRHCLSDQWRSNGSMLGLAGLDMLHGNPLFFGPFQQLFTDVFRAIVDPYGARLAPPLDV